MTLDDALSLLRAAEAEGDLERLPALIWRVVDQLKALPRDGAEFQTGLAELISCAEQLTSGASRNQVVEALRELGVPEAALNGRMPQECLDRTGEAPSQATLDGRGPLSQEMGPQREDRADGRLGARPSTLPIGTTKLFDTLAGIQLGVLAERDPSAQLRQIADLVLKLVGAERVFIASPGGEDSAEPKILLARIHDKSDIPLAGSVFPAVFYHRVMKDRTPLHLDDAANDEKLVSSCGGARSVICQPLLVDGKPTGALYLDDRLRGGSFTADHMIVAEYFASLVAIVLGYAHRGSNLDDARQELERWRERVRSLEKRLEGSTSLPRRSPQCQAAAGKPNHDYSSIVGTSDEMKRVFAELDRIITTELPVMIHGESGTGKELIARAIHYNGPRRDKPFVVENCAALPDALLESELFGHVRGAFTGADRAKKGLLKQATGGTLFLDEIGDMSTEMQKKLLRVLQEGEVRPLGSNQVIQVDVRLLAASHANLEELVKQGRFREDLFYRVNVLALHLPPLRTRREDIPLLADVLLARAAREVNRPAPHLAHEVLAALSGYDWPGNVRELENEMRRVLLLAGETVHLEHLTKAIPEAAKELQHATQSIQTWMDEPREPTHELREAVAVLLRRLGSSTA